jgi:putative transposase
LSDEKFCRIFLHKLGQARKKHGFLVWAYVVMPEHVHLLLPARRATTSAILKSVKQSTAQTIVARLKKEDPDRLRCMVSGAHRGDSPYSFWQVGGGYDRNVHGPEEYWGCVRYIHANPVRRGLVERPEDWRWSSARNYMELPPYEFEVDRCQEWI